MKKNSKMVSALMKEMETKNAVVAAMRKEIANKINDEAKQHAEALIAEKEAELETLKTKVAELENDESDKSEEVEALIKELSAKIVDTENAVKQSRKLFVNVENFVDSKEGMKAFVKAVNNSRNKEEFNANWGRELTANGVTWQGTSPFAPAAVLAEINDAWENTADGFMSILDVTGLRAIKIATDTNSDDTSRAHGHVRGAEKAEQVLNLSPKEIRAQVVYKYISLDRETIEYEDTNDLLVRYVARELAYRILHEIMRAVLIGDGRQSNDPGKISKIESVARQNSDAYVTTFALPTSQALPTMVDIANLVDSIQDDGDIHLFVSKQTARSLRAYVAAAGGDTQYRSLDEIAAELGVAEIHTTDLLNKTVAGEATPLAVAFVGKSYKIVGDVTMAGFNDFNLSKNQYQYLTECYIGGALARPKSGACLYSNAD